MGALLESTTLGEFLTAVENVRKKSELELADLEQTEEGVRRRPSFLERIVIGSRRSSEGSRSNLRLSFVSKPSVPPLQAGQHEHGQHHRPPRHGDRGRGDHPGRQPQ